MPEDLAKFLNKDKPKDFITNTSGTFQCQHCDEIIYNAKFDEEEGTIIWYCSENHKSQVAF